MDDYKLVYSRSFKNSLEEIIHEWEFDLCLSEEKIAHFVKNIYRSLELLKLFPEMHEEVSDLYGFNQPTYRILIGKAYAIFYRIDVQSKEILIGNIYKQRQLHLKF